MQEGIPLSLAQLLGDKGFYEYVNQVIFPELQTLQEQNAISPFVISKLREQIQEKGWQVISPVLYPGGRATLTSREQGSGFFFADLPLTQDIGLRHFIKRHPSTGQEAYSTAKQNQISLEEALRGTPQAKYVPGVAFSNDKERIIANTMVNGITLREALEKTADKHEMLKRVIMSYTDLHTAINEGEKQPDFPQFKNNFSNYVKDIYQGSSIEQLDKEVLQALDQASTQNMHRDTHPYNILIDEEGEPHFIDWSFATSTGFYEFDIGTLLGKSGLPIEEERELALFAAEQKYQSSKEQKESLERFIKKQIMQDLIYAKRYADNSNEDVKDPQTLKSVAKLHFNNALKRIRTAPKNMFSEQLYKEVEDLKGALSESGVVLNEQEHNALKDSLRDYIILSAANYETPQPIIQGTKVEDVQELFENKFKRRNWRRNIAGALAAVSLVGLVSIGTWYFVGEQNRWQQEQITQQQNKIQSMQKEEEEKRKSRAQNEELQTYTNNFSESYNQLFKKIVDRKVNKKDLFERNGRFIQEISKETGIK